MTKYGFRSGELSETSYATAKYVLRVHKPEIITLQDIDHILHCFQILKDIDDTGLCRHEKHHFLFYFAKFSTAGVPLCMLVVRVLVPVLRCEVCPA